MAELIAEGDTPRASAPAARLPLLADTTNVSMLGRVTVPSLQARDLGAFFAVDRPRL
jgi:hypothetical protein